MPSSCGYSWSQEIEAAIKDRAAAYALPLDLAYSFTAGESGFDQYSAGDAVGNGAPGFDDNPAHGVVVTGPDGHKGMSFPNAGGVRATYVAWEGHNTPGQYYWSHGLMQLMTGGGQGSPSPGVSMSWSDLVNPWTNLDVGFPHIAAAFRSCWSPTVDPYEFIHCVMSSSGHPGPISSDDYRLTRMFPIWQCFFTALQGQGGGSIPPPDPPPDPTPPIPDSPGLTFEVAAVALGALGMVVIGALAFRRPVIVKKTLPDGGMKKLIK